MVHVLYTDSMFTFVIAVTMYMAWILPIRRKTQDNQSINHIFVKLLMN